MACAWHSRLADVASDMEVSMQASMARHGRTPGLHALNDVHTILNSFSLS